MKYKSFGLIILLISVSILFSCKKSDTEIIMEDIVMSSDDLSDIIKRGKLRVITLESAYSYFVDAKGDECGYDYDLSRNFADYLDLDYELIVASNVEDMINKLLVGEGDMIAFRIHASEENLRYLSFTEYKDYSNMVVVQRRQKERVGTILDLRGDTIYTRSESKYAMRLRHINEEIGGGIINVCVPDSVSIDKMLLMVSKGEIDYCLVDEDIAKTANLKLKNLDCTLNASVKLSKSWAVRNTSDSLLTVLNEWRRTLKPKLIKILDNKYLFNNSYIQSFQVEIPAGAISPYDEYFKQYSEVIGWDWRLLASLAYHESRFNPNIMSSQGALGIMQIMPKTAAKFGLDEVSALDPERNIEAGVRYIKRLEMIFSSIENKEERIKFILAGYNAGPGHIFDAMALAEKYGANPNIWFGNVETYLLLKNQEEYYNDSVCKHGFFRGKHTVEYVHDVYDTYYIYCENK